MDEPPGTLVQRIFCCIDVNSRGCVPSHTLLRLLQVSKPSLATRGYIPMTQTRNTSSLCTPTPGHRSFTISLHVVLA
jgi:hypothetical protein